MKVDPVAAIEGETTTVPVKLTNHGDAPASGTLTATAPAGLTVTPASAIVRPAREGSSRRRSS